MFNKDKNASASERQYPASATLISSGTVLEGDVKSESDLRIDGTVKGNIISSSKIIIGPTGYVEGNIHSAHADISGKVQGNVVVKELLQLRSQGHVKGNITAVKLQIDQNSVFNGQCHMGTMAAASVVKLNEPDVQAKAN